ncbi:hypothetical protein [Solemya velesiana gill symbiont]|uniref:Double Cache domain-containing protein n=1 Tax=Solemya velesiana gill symbiont TaxID=1918948 RepID=A0A1T2KS39_9GAMM|nr:hypothetical protein [Solemya velesiana gill symbiont]OOZ35642.1 hypothetical protein BOW51_11045 [Solemya velesiana gill symbiont]
MKLPLIIAIILFGIAELLFGWWLWSEVRTTTQRSLLFHQTELKTGFRSVVDSHGKLVETSLHYLLQKKQLLPMIAEAADPDTVEASLRRIRGRLYRTRYSDYKNLLEQDIRVLQFVMPDGRSLLRFNRPDLYDYPITKDRPLIAEVLESGKPGAAFENGRVYPGFRYVFPLHFAGRLVGVADFSLSYDGIRRSFAESKQVTGSVSQIVLRRDLLEAVTHPSAKSLFRTSAINPDYVVEEEGSPLKDILRLEPLPDWVDSLDKLLQASADVQQAMSEGRQYSVTECTSQAQCYSIALNPVLDSSKRAAAYMEISSFSNQLL